MLHVKFHGNRLAGSQKKIFEGIFTIYGCGGHFGHVTSIVSSDFQSLVPKAFIQNLVQISTVVSEKIQFEFFYVPTCQPADLLTHLSSLIYITSMYMLYLCFENILYLG